MLNSKYRNLNNKTTKTREDYNKITIFFPYQESNKHNSNTKRIIHFLVKMIIIFFTTHSPCFAVETDSNGETLHSGLGFATTSSGRAILALDFGMTFNSDRLLSIMTVGAATTAYFYSEYAISAFKWQPLVNNTWGRFFCGYGGGVAYSQKAILKDSASAEEDKNQNITIGPAFRVEYRPADDFDAYIASEFIMGLGIASIGNGFGDVGRISVGIRL